jgi:serine/threonine protein kinase
MGKWVPKITDFGMCRWSLSEINQTDTSKVPILWTPPEGLLPKPKYSKSSDVWAWAIVYLEMYLGDPYLPEHKAHFSDQQIGLKVRDERYKPLIPPECASEQMAILLLACLTYDMAGRPTFEEICQRMDVIYSSSI